MRYHIFYPFTASIVDSRGLLIFICKRQQFECDVTSYNVRRCNAKIENRNITEYTESFLWFGNIRWNNSTSQSTKSSGTIIDIEIIVSRWFTPFTYRDDLMVLFGYAIKSIVSCVNLLFIRPWRCKQTTVRIMLGVITSHIKCMEVIHCSDIIMSAVMSQITILTIVYSTFIQTQIKVNIKVSRHWPLCGEFTGHRWIPRTKG